MADCAVGPVPMVDHTLVKPPLRAQSQRVTHAIKRTRIEASAHRLRLTIFIPPSVIGRLGRPLDREGSAMYVSRLGHSVIVFAKTDRGGIALLFLKHAQCPTGAKGRVGRELSRM
jgi:hypothetical protein